MTKLRTLGCLWMAMGWNQGSLWVPSLISGEMSPGCASVTVSPAGQWTLTAVAASGEMSCLPCRAVSLPFFWSPPIAQRSVVALGAAYPPQLLLKIIVTKHFIAQQMECQAKLFGGGIFFLQRKKKFNPGLFVIFILYFCASENPLFPYPCVEREHRYT